MRVRTAHHVSIDHIGQVNVIHIVASALDESQIFFALDGMAHATDFRRCWEDHLYLLDSSWRRHTVRPSQCSGPRYSGTDFRKSPNESPPHWGSCSCSAGHRPTSECTA